MCPQISKGFVPWLDGFWHFNKVSILFYSMFMRTYASSRGKERAFKEKVNSRCFRWFPAAILVHQNGTPIWRLHTKLYKGAWNVLTNNSFIAVNFLCFFHWTVPNIFFVAWQWNAGVRTEYDQREMFTIVHLLSLIAYLCIRTSRNPKVMIQNG